jgi:hypothetical protein
MEPYADRGIQLWQDYEIGLINDYGGVLAETSTDSNGYFKLMYSKENQSYYPVIQSTGGYKIIGVPWVTNIYDLSAYVTPTCTLYSNRLSSFRNDL